jgi:RimJ/RimL family protein N-acetyltransferase
VEDGVVNQVPPVTLSDGRLVLRPPTPDLIPQIAAARQDAELHRWLAGSPPQLLDMIGLHDIGDQVPPVSLLAPAASR